LPVNLAQNSGSSGGGSGRGSGGSSVRRETSKQTLASDLLLATDSSINHQRDNIKQFSFKPSNVRQSANQLQKFALNHAAF